MSYHCPAGFGKGRLDTKSEVREVPEGEEIVGFYGIAAKANKLSALGFITNKIFGA